MGHDITKQVLGATDSTFKNVDNVPGNIAAGLACVQKSDGTVTTTLADGALLGVSLGKDLSGTDRFTPVCRKGIKVPILVGTLTPVIGAQVQLHATSGKAVDSGTAVNATIASGLKDAVLEDGTTVTNGCILIDFPGGF